MQGFIARSDPAGRCGALVTMTPALIVLAIGVDPTTRWSSARSCCRSASRSRWCRSCCSRGARDIMGALVNRRLTTVVAGVVAAVIIALNLFLLAETFGLV